MPIIISTLDSLQMREKVDQYLELHEEMGKLKKAMDSLKKDIRSHMEERGIDSLQGTNGKRVCLQEAKASNSSSVFMDYELSAIYPILGEDTKKVTEIRVNAKKLEGLVTMLSPEQAQKIAAAKIVKNGTPRFTVKG